MSDTPPIQTAPAMATPPGKMSASAITSLVLGILGFCTGITGVIGLFVGIFSVVLISRSEGRLRGGGLAIAGIVVSGVSVVVSCLLTPALMLPALAKARSNAQRLKLEFQARQLGQAVVLFADASDGVLPVDDWEQVLVSQAYITPDLVISPADPASGRCFAINENLRGVHVDELGDTPNVVLFFQCVPGSPLAGGPELLPPNEAFDSGAVIVFADSMAEFVPAGEYGRLEWEP